MNETAMPAGQRINRACAEEYLRRYSDLNILEQQELITFLKKGDPVTLALMQSEPELQPLMERFRQDHPAAFNRKKLEILTLCGLALAFAAIMLILWDYGVK